MIYMHYYQKIKNKNIVKARIILILSFFCLVCSYSNAQKRPNFSPERFEAELEQFITTDACLTPEESARFFPVYREMRKKQRNILDKNRFMRHFDFNDDKACAEVIRRNDANDIEMKRCQREYHEKFMKILPASKVFRIIRSEDKFHKRIFRKAFNKRGK